MSDSTIVILLGIAACAIVVVAPVLLFVWLKRSYPRLHAAVSYLLALAVVSVLPTPLIASVLVDLFPTERDADMVAAFVLGPMIVGGFVIVRHRRAISAWAHHRFALSFLPRLIAAALLGLAPMSWPQDYYVLLRWLVFGTSFLVVFVAWPRRRFFWVWLFSMAALLFNPIRIFRFTHEEIWHVADFLLSASFVVSCVFVSERQSVIASSQSPDGAA